MEERVQGKRVAPRSRRGSVIAIVLVAVLILLLVGGYLGLCAYASGDKLLPGTTVAGVDLGGKTPQEAAALLEQVDVCGDRSVSVQLGDKAVSLSAREAGVSMDVAGAVAAAEESSRSSFLAAGVRFIGALFQSTEVDYDIVVRDQGYVDRVLAALTDGVEQAAADTTWSVDMEGAKVSITKGRTGRRLDVETAGRQALEALRTGDASSVRVEMTEAAPTAPDYDEIVRQVNREPVDAALDAGKDKILDEARGYNVDAGALRRAYEAAGEGQRCVVPIAVLEPQVTAAELRESLFRDLLGEATSYISGTSARFNNVTLATAACNGTILLPGEQFSYNGTTGQRTAEKGYQSAPGYAAGTTVMMIGGGVCQPSSTLYLATLYADLTTVERHAHMFAVGYVPDGMDATVDWPDVDFKFENSTPYPIRIDMTIKNRNLYVKIYGTKTTTNYVEMDNVRIATNPAETVYRADETVPQGTTRTVQSAHTGRKVESYKSIYAADGTLISRTLVNRDNYLRSDKIVAYNPLDGLPAEALPDPSEGEETDPSAAPADPGTVPVDPGTTPVDPGTTPVDPGVTEPTEPGTPVGPSEEVTPGEPAAPAEPDPAPESPAPGVPEGIPLD